MLFHESMAPMVQAGITLQVALEKFFDHRVLGPICRRMHAGVTNGDSLGEVVSREQALFGPMDQARLAQAEATGNLDRAFGDLFLQAKATGEMRDRMVSMLILPTLYMLAGLLIMPIPAVYTGKLPLLLYLTPVGIAGALVGSGLYISRMSQPLLWLDDSILGTLCNKLVKVPILRGLLLARSRHGFADGMHLTLHTGMSLESALPLIMNRIPVPKWRASLTLAMKHVLDGGELGNTLAATNFLSSQDCIRIKSGERAGSLDQAFAAIAIDAQVEVEKKLKVLARIVATTVSVAVLLAIGASIVNSFTGYLDQVDSF